MANLATLRRPAPLAWGFYLWIALLASLVLLGLYAFWQQTLHGHELTGANDLMPWGLYIVGFVFFVGASTGATIIGLLVHGFGRQDYAPLATRAIIFGLLALAVSVMFIVADVGSIPRLLRVPFIWRNPTSMFTYTSLTYYVFGLILLAELYFTVKMNKGTASASDRARAKWLALIAVPFALVALNATDGALFAVVKSRDLWNTPLLAPHFSVLAVVSGTAIMILIAVLNNVTSGRASVGARTLSHMGILLAFFLAVAGLLDLFDFLVYVYSDEPAAKEALRLLSTTHLPFTVLHVAGLAVAFLILMFRQGRTAPWLTVAAVVAVAAVAAYRYNLVIVGMEIPLFPFLEQQIYTPSAYELATAVGLVAFLLLGYLVLTRVLPMENQEAARVRAAAKK